MKVLGTEEGLSKCYYHHHMLKGKIYDVTSFSFSLCSLINVR